MWLARKYKVHLSRRHVTQEWFVTKLTVGAASARGAPEPAISHLAAAKHVMPLGSYLTLARALNF